MIPTQIPNSGIIEAIQRGTEISVCVPDDMPSPMLCACMMETGRYIGNVGRSGRVALYALGKMMAMAKARKSFLPDCGFEKFSEFEAALGAAVGKGHTTLWNWKPIYEELPNLTIEQLEGISQQHLSLIVQHVPESKRELALEYAKELSFKNFKKYAAEQGLVTEDQMTGASLIISGSKEEIDELTAFLDHPAIKAFAGNYIEVLLGMKAENQTGAPDNGWPRIE